MGEPGTIRKLSEDVVNRIAAGEIVQRPANALKELLENSLDAKSSNIMITVKAGGLKFLQIQDNGTGIRYSDLPILCERFTTSKLEQYEDLREISTYGFRGEALASISHIAHLSILTKTVNDKCAYKATYEDGKLKGPIKASAGNNGTQITVEDLFYNVLTRKRALRSPTEEYSHVMEVVGSYAIHNSGVGFTLKKFGENIDIKTPINSSVIENVRVIYGNAIARELMEIKMTDAQLRMSVNGFITNVNYSNKKGTFLLFINHRLVDSVSIRKAMDSVYSTYLPKNAHSFVYLSIELDPKNVDVNVHPTKHEVHFLYEEQIIEKIKSCVESKLLSCNSTRVMYTQARLPGATIVTEDILMKKNSDTSKIHASNLVRMSSDVQKIHKFFKPSRSVSDCTEIMQNTRLEHSEFTVDLNKSTVDPNKQTVETDKSMVDVEQFISKVDPEQTAIDSNKLNENTVSNEQMIVDSEKQVVENAMLVDANESVVDQIDSDQLLQLNTDSEKLLNIKEKWKNHTNVQQNEITYIDPKESFKTRIFNQERIETKLTSVKQLRMDTESACNMNLREILANLIYIGCINTCKTLIQHSTKLYLCDTIKMTEELFYETLLYDFQNFGFIKLSNPLPLEELFILGLNTQEHWDPDLGDKKEMAEQMVELLVGKKAMLYEYFSMEISQDGNLIALPLLLDGHTPFMGALPAYLVRLVSEVNWENEKECFNTFSRQTAMFYSQPNPDKSVESIKSEQWKQEHVIYPAIRRNFLPPNRFITNGSILQIANLSDLYKVFERC